ncbi:2-isopropylmalate synthase [Nocardia callitridis]|uniref:2-isopropylmalate synthase LeuA allosteric (dimerisation) domain-containing protein n=1 Tax=Nocardia callitridis TaxID=648753 RepID=A0ABP9KID4_9NOCA
MTTSFTHTFASSSATTDTSALRDAAPKGLRVESADLTPGEFHHRFHESTGRIRLVDCSAGSGTNAEFIATMEFADRLRTVVANGGPVAALTSAFYDEGYPFEILRFHQRHTAHGYATFVHGECDGRRGWGAALADNPTESTIRAMISGVNLLGR